MLTIGQLADYAGVTVRAVRHYHHVGLLPEPERDASGYRRYGATAVVALIKIRALAAAGVPLGQIRRMLDADRATFADAARAIDDRLRDEIERLESSRKQIAQLASGDSLVLPPEVVSYLDRLRAIGVSDRVVAGERDGWILMAARWPDEVRAWIPSKVAQLADPRVVRLYRLLSDIVDDDGGDDETRLREVADIMAGLLADAAEAGADLTSGDDLPFDLLEALATESDARATRLRMLMRERGWAGWIRSERLPEPPGR